MSVDELLKKYSPEQIQSAAHRIAVSKEMRKKLSRSRWSDAPLVFDNTTSLIPSFEDRRPLAVTLHGYGLWIDPIYTLHHSGKPDKDFSLHIEEEPEGLRIHVEDAFDIILEGSYGEGFVLKIKVEENTKIEEVKE